MMYGRTAGLLLGLAVWKPVFAAPQMAAATTGLSSSTDPSAQATFSNLEPSTSSYGSNTQVYSTVSAVPTTSSNVTASDPCALIAQEQVAWNRQHQLAVLPENVPVSTNATWQCIQSIKVVKDDAAAMLQVLKQYVSFQTTLAYLKNPPPSYQQGAIDVMAELDRMASRLQADGYNLQYDFDEDLKSIFVRAHEGHLQVSAGISAGGLVMWSVPDSLIAYSTDGKAIPKVYAYSDTLQALQHTLDWTSSAITSINGVDPVDYIKQLASTTRTGSIEPHGDWNFLMTNNALLFSFAQGADLYSPQYSGFQRQGSYNGTSLAVTFENGTSNVWPFYASVTKHLDSVTGFKDFYSLIRDSTSATAAATSVASSAATSNAANMMARQADTLTSSKSYPTQTALPKPNYPQNPVVIQERFGAGGTVSGYILNDISVGVLVLPSFAAGDGSSTAQSFATAVQDFIDKARAANVQQVIIDVSGNPGGNSLLGYDTFKRFFPNIDPNLGIRLRATPQTNTIGKIVNGISQNKVGLWTPEQVKVVQDFLDQAPSLNLQANSHLDGSPLSSWDDYFSPHIVQNDSFTNSARWNLSIVANSLNSIDGKNIAGYGNNLLPYSQPPWSPSSILLLTDGVCASTCTIFAELMKTHAGVLDIAMGGLPETGPMQGVSGTRGSNVFEFSAVDDLLGKVTTLFNELSSSQRQQAFQALNITQADLDALPPPLSSARLALGGSVNFADEIRTNATDWPLSMVYEPSDCRLFYTAAMVQDQSQVWRAAAKVLGGDYSMCVDNSVNATGSLPNCTVTSSPGFGSSDFWSNANTTNSLKVQATCLGSSSKSAAVPGYLEGGLKTAVIAAAGLVMFLML